MKSISSRKSLIGALVATVVVVLSLVAATPAQAAPAPDKVSATWQTAATTGGEVGTRALCSTPTRLTTQAIWDCTVFSGQYIQAWIMCSGYVYYSPLIGEGWWWIIGTCPPGTLRDTEGIIYF